MPKRVHRVGNKFYIMPVNPVLADKDLLQHIDHRNNFFKLLAVNKNFFGTNPELKLPIVFPLKYDSNFEEIGCVGYHPVLSELAATIKIKRSNGYSGGLCTNGSIEYVRFFLDYGSGWQDMGVSSVNVHDLPDSKDCSGAIEKPISYTVRLKINPKHLSCKVANLPKVKAILSWNSAPPAGNPNPNIIWGDSKEVNIQVSPLTLLFPSFPIDKFGLLINKAMLNPQASIAGIASTLPNGLEQLKELQTALVAPKVEIGDLIKLYAAQKVVVEPERIGAKILAESLTTKNPSIVAANKNLFSSVALDWDKSIVKFQALNGNTSFEELHCVGADYKHQALVATFKVKKSSGYSGDLCSKGSKEYVGFWIQSEPSCKWEYVGTSFVNAFDVAMSADGLSYSVVLPIDLTKYQRNCDAPVILKVRGVLSWNVAPSTTNPAKVPYWGNIVDSYIQVAPGAVIDTSKPVMITLGGVSIDNINDATGLTKPGAFIEINHTATYPGSPFGGIIVMQGLTDPYQGMKYRVKVTNLNDGTSYYLNNRLYLLGYDIATNTITHPHIDPDASNYYTYQSIYGNLDMILANFTPGTNDKLQITLELLGGGSVSKTIQMDSVGIQTSLVVEKAACGGYAKGDHIKGTFSVTEPWLVNYILASGFAPNTYSGTTSIGVTAFDFDTSGSTSPCGAISLTGTVKTIISSVTPGYPFYNSVTVCLKN
jgi:hypothetical protein